jgi:hypothetical protein
LRIKGNIFWQEIKKRWTCVSGLNESGREEEDNECSLGARLDTVTEVISFWMYNHLIKLVLLGSHFLKKGKLSTIGINLMIVNNLGLHSPELDKL